MGGGSLTSCPEMQTSTLHLGQMPLNSVINHSLWDVFELDPTESQKQFLYSKFKK